MFTTEVVCDWNICILNVRIEILIVCLVMAYFLCWTEPETTVCRAVYVRQWKALNFKGSVCVSITALEHPYSAIDDQLCIPLWCHRPKGVTCGLSAWGLCAAVWLPERARETHPTVHVSAIILSDREKTPRWRWTLGWTLLLISRLSGRNTLPTPAWETWFVSLGVRSDMHTLQRQQRLLSCYPVSGKHHISIFTVFSGHSLIALHNKLIFWDLIGVMAPSGSHVCDYRMSTPILSTPQVRVQPVPSQVTPLAVADCSKCPSLTHGESIIFKFTTLVKYQSFMDNYIIGV